LGLCGFMLVGWGPVTINGYFMDYHFLFPSALCVILGMQLILFTFLAKVYTGLSKYDLKLKELGRILTVERTMVIGICIFMAGLLINVEIVMAWLNTYGQGLFAVRPAIVALTLMAVGAQIFFN